MIIRIGLLCLFCGLGFKALAQEKQNTRADSASVTIDTTSEDQSKSAEKIVSYSNRFDPRKAILLAAVLPGAGQIYNQKYWKVPLVWGGLGLIVNAVYVYQNGYVKYKNELFLTLNTPGNTPLTTGPSGIDQTTLRAIVDVTRRQRDYFLAIGGLVYILQMVDAHVDSHLKEFDLNPKLRARVKPYMEQNMMMGRISGAAIVFKF